MGESSDTPLKLESDRGVRVETRRATIASDAGLLACREVDRKVDAIRERNYHGSRRGRRDTHQARALPLRLEEPRFSGMEQRIPSLSESQTDQVGVLGKG